MLHRPVTTRAGARRATSERAQATPLLALVLVLAGLCLVPVGHLVRATLDRAEARTAADAAALAAALEGEPAARAVAAANGGNLVELRWRAGSVDVTVEVGDHRATARAERIEVRRRPAGT